MQHAALENMHFTLGATQSITGISKLLKMICLSFTPSSAKSCAKIKQDVIYLFAIWSFVLFGTERPKKRPSFTETINKRLFFQKNDGIKALPSVES